MSPTCVVHGQLIDTEVADSEVISVLAGEYADEYDDARYFLVRRSCVCVRGGGCTT